MNFCSMSTWNLDAQELSADLDFGGQTAQRNPPERGEVTAAARKRVAVVAKQPIPPLQICCEI